MIRRFRDSRFKVLSESSAVVFFICTGIGAIWFVLPPLAESLVGNLTLVGALLALPAVMSFIVDIPLGDLCDKADKKKILFWGLILTGVTGAYFGLIDSVTDLVLYLIAFGVLHTIAYIVTAAYVMDASPKNLSSTYLGTYTSFMHLGFALGALVAGYLASDALLSKTGLVGWFFAGLCVLGAVASLSLAPGKSKCLRDGICEVIRIDGVFKKEISDFRALGFTGVAVVGLTLLLTVFDGIVWTLEPLLYRQFNLPTMAGGVILAAFVVPLIVFEAPAGYLADRVGKRKVLFIGLIVAGVSTVLFSFSSSFTALVAYAFITTTGISLVWPATEGILADHAADKKKGEVIGVWRSSADLGYVIGPLTGGILAQYTSITTVFSIAGVVLVAASLLALSLGKIR
ncbi:MAG: MFS transporter [Methanobacteriota archaeon]